MHPCGIPTARAEATIERFRTGAGGGASPTGRGGPPHPGGATPGAGALEGSGAFLLLFSEKMVTSKADWDQNKMAIVKDAVGSSKNDVIHAAG